VIKGCRLTLEPTSHFPVIVSVTTIPLPLTMTPSTASFSSFELIDSHVKLVPVETLCVKESAMASSESAEVVRPTTSNPVLATLCGKESAAPTWQETASSWWDLQLAVAVERTHQERVALCQSSTSPLPIPLLTDLPQPTWQLSPPTWTQTITELPGWLSPPISACYGWSAVVCDVHVVG
jgi:hypothetical protein